MDEALGPDARGVPILTRAKTDLILHNPEFREVTRYWLAAKMSRAKARERLEALNGQKSQLAAVWVPPSSARSSRHGSKKSQVDDVNFQIREAKAEIKLQGGEMRRLTLMRVFMAWRSMGALRRKLLETLETIEAYELANLSRRTFTAWKDVAEPWVYDESVLESVGLFQMVSQLGQQDRLVQHWRSLAAERRDLEARCEVFKEHIGRRVMRDALIHWKVYRLIHHLGNERDGLASRFDSTRRMKSVFSYWCKRARRRVELQGRMETAVFLPCRSELTVDDLLLLGSPVPRRKYVVINDFLLDQLSISASRNLVHQLKVASRDMSAKVRWKHLNDVEWTTSPHSCPVNIAKADEHSSGPVEDANCDPIQELLDKMESYREEEGYMLNQQRAVLADLAKLSRNKIPRLQKKRHNALRSLEKCESFVADLGEVRQRLESKLQVAIDVVCEKEKEHADATSAMQRLESLHSSSVASVESERLRVSSHAAECAKIDKQICHWEAIVAELSQKASAPTATSARGRGDVTISVKLEESKRRFQQVKDRKNHMDSAYGHVVRAQQEASVAESNSRHELEQARRVAEKSHDTLLGVKSHMSTLTEQKNTLQEDYDGLLACLQNLLSTVEALDVAIAESFDQASLLDDQHENLGLKLEDVQRKMELLERDIHKEKGCETAERSEEHIVPTLSHVSDEPVLSETPWDNSVLLSMATKRRSMIPGDRLLLRSARSFHILWRAKACLSHWKTLTECKRAARQKADKDYCLRIAPKIITAWRHYTLLRSESMAQWNARRVLNTALSAWRRATHEVVHNKHLVESCRKLSVMKMKKIVFPAWREVTEEALLHDYTSHRLGLSTQARLFSFWKEKAARSTYYSQILSPIMEKRDSKLCESSFLRWRQAAQSRLTLRRVLNRACTAWSLCICSDEYFASGNESRVLKDCMNAWSLVVHQSREARRLDSIHAKIDTRHTQRILRTHFVALRNTIQEQKQYYEAVVNAFQEHRCAKTRKSVMEYLLAWSARRNLTVARLRVAWTHDHRLKKAITAWRQALDKTHQMNDKQVICDKLRRILACDSHAVVEAEGEEIKSTTYVAAEASFCCSIHVDPHDSGTAIDAINTTAISL
jgi:hypothetical protein